MYSILLWICCMRIVESQKGYHIKIDDELPAISWEECGISDRLCEPNKGLDPLSVSQRVFGGENAATGEFPWFAELHIQFIREVEGKVEIAQANCGGAIISEWWILTASHCLMSKGTRVQTTVYVTVGSIAKYGGQTYKSDKIIIHPKFLYISLREQFLKKNMEKIEQMITELKAKNKKTDKEEEELKRDSDEYEKNGLSYAWMYYDIGLVKVSQPIVPERNRTHYIVNSVCLPKSGIVNTNREVVRQSGLGRLDSSGKNKPSILQKHKILIQTKDECNRLAVCQTTDNSGWNSSPCEGDSGSPIVQYFGCKAVVIGDFMGHLDEKPNISCGHFALWPRTSQFMPWIRSHIIPKPIVTAETNHLLITFVIIFGVIAVFSSLLLFWLVRKRQLMRH